MHKPISKEQRKVLTQILNRFKQSEKNARELYHKLIQDSNPDCTEYIVRTLDLLIASTCDTHAALQLLAEEDVPKIFYNTCEKIEEEKSDDSPR